MKKDPTNRIAAKRIGISYEEYMRRRDAGLKWCTGCKDWHPKLEFSRDASRGDGLRSECRKARQDRLESNFVPIDGEEWRSIVGFEGEYEVSNLGRVRRIAERPRATTPPRTLTQTSSHGYMRVSLIARGKIKVVGVHELVCRAFHGPSPLPKMEPNHKDGIPSNNVESNLEWVTRSGNCLHAYAMGLSVPKRGSQNGNARLTENEVREIIALEGKLSRPKIGKRYGVSKTVVERIHKGRLWGHLRQMPAAKGKVTA